MYQQRDCAYKRGGCMVQSGIPAVHLSPREACRIDVEGAEESSILLATSPVLGVREK